MALLFPARHERILRTLRQEGAVSVNALSQSLTVTRETIRRDLDQLESAGHLTRVHGGAIASTAPSRAEQPVRTRQGQHTEQKLRIARAALKFLPPSAGGSAVLDAGTTTEALAEQLAAMDPTETEHRHLITNSVSIGHKLSSTSSFDVEILGGTIRGVTGAAVGPQTIHALQRRRADVVFLGTNGISAEFGLSTPNADEAAVKTALIEAGRTRILLADSSKLGQSSLVRFGLLEDIDTLITDTAPHGALAKALAEADVTVLEAP